jgi:ribonucleoside-diphosphate reductase alpha chain
MLAMLGVRYGSPESIAIVEDVYRELALATYRSSAIMAQERGAFPIHNYERERDHVFMRQLFDADPELEQLVAKYGRRNIACNTTAPAGTVSLMTQTSSGIEPVFLLSYTRRSKISSSDKNAVVSFVDDMGDRWQEFEVFHHGFKQWMDITGKTPKDVAESPYWGATSADIDWEAKVRLQAAAQKWVDHSISNTTNIPENTPIDVTKKIYMTGWESGCKGVTVYRAGSRSGVLIEKKDAVAFKQYSAPKRAKELQCRIHHANIKNETWTILVGLMDGKPYEIFGGLSRFVEIPKKYDEGILLKNDRKASNSTYDLKIGNGSELVIKNVVDQFDNPNYSTMTRMISLALRHGADAQYVAEQLQKGDKDSDIFSFAKVIARVLKTYIKDGVQTTVVKVCPMCSGTQFAYQENCPSCIACGWQKC